jgi:hypothetical protein
MTMHDRAVRAEKVLGVGRSPLELLGFALMVALVAVASATLFGKAVGEIGGRDMSAYWNAAMRLRDGLPLYQSGLPTDSDLYRYAPWFAAAWMPLTYLPRDAVLIGWSTLLVGASLATTLPLLRHGATGIALCALLLPIQLEGAAYGNVQPLLVFALVWGVERRSGALWIALAASLKVVPILLVLVQVGRGEYRKALVTVALTVLLVLPMLFFNLAGYSTSPGPEQISLAGTSVVAWMVIALLLCGVTVALSRTRFRWLAASAAMIAALPRLLFYEFSFLLVSFADPRPERLFRRLRSG